MLLNPSAPFPSHPSRTTPRVRRTVRPFVACDKNHARVASRSRFFSSDPIHESPPLPTLHTQNNNNNTCTGHAGLNVTDREPANYVKSPLGVVYEKINEGSGDPAKPGDVGMIDA